MRAIRIPTISRMIQKDEIPVNTANNMSIGFLLVDGVISFKMPMGQV